MNIIGILGGVASGKTFVAEQLRRLGAEVINADQIGHEVLQEPEVIQAARERWGDAVIDGSGQILRSAVAKLVFAPTPDGKTQLAFWEQVTHPRIGDRLRSQFERWSQSGEVDVVVLDAPVMRKAGWDQLCQRIVFVEAPWELRRQRALQRGWTAADFEARERAQESLDTKRQAADWIIDNSGSLDETIAQVRQLWRSLSEQSLS